MGINALYTFTKIVIHNASLVCVASTVFFSHTCTQYVWSSVAFQDLMITVLSNTCIRFTCESTSAIEMQIQKGYYKTVRSAGLDCHYSVVCWISVRCGTVSIHTLLFNKDALWWHKQIDLIATWLPWQRGMQMSDQSGPSGITCLLGRVSVSLAQKGSSFHSLSFGLRLSAL